MPDNSVKGHNYYAKANGSFGKGEQEKPPPVLAVTLQTLELLPRPSWRNSYCSHWQSTCQVFPDLAPPFPCLSAVFMTVSWDREGSLFLRFADMKLRARWVPSVPLDRGGFHLALPAPTLPRYPSLPLEAFNATWPLAEQEELQIIVGENSSDTLRI